jgi:hypothetical protein
MGNLIPEDSEVNVNTRECQPTLEMSPLLRHKKCPLFAEKGVFDFS